MQKQISIPYRLSLDDSSAMVLLFYTLERNEQMILMNCYVEGAYPHDIGWLQLRNFQIRTSRTSEGYAQLFDEYEGARNLDTTLFIEQAYTAIMTKEKLKIALALAA